MVFHSILKSKVGRRKGKREETVGTFSIEG
jgi:hypothetical protein